MCAAGRRDDMKWRDIEMLTIIFSWGAGLVIVSAVLAILGFLFYWGHESIGIPLVFGTASPLQALMLSERVFDGLFPAIVGTVMLVVLSIAWAVPIGIATGIYLVEYANIRVKRVLNLLIDILSGIPSIVVGLFGFALTVFLHKRYSADIQPCLLASSAALALLVLPYMIRTTQSALEGIPRDIRLTALALGGTRLQNLFYVLIPRSLSGIMSGVVLSISRCAEDTAVIMLTGAVASAGIPMSVLSRYEALPFYIYYISSQYSSPEELSTGYGAAIILLILCCLLISMAHFVRRGLTHATLFRP